jgi:hypothetical protein
LIIIIILILPFAIITLSLLMPLRHYIERHYAISIAGHYAITPLPLITPLRHY